MPPVTQCYRRVAAPRWAPGTQAPSFPSQDIDQSGYQATPTADLGVGKTPALNVANTGEIAIEATTAEPRTFFATNELVADSNQRLEESGSTIRLAPGSESLEVPSDPGSPPSPGEAKTRLYQVTPMELQGGMPAPLALTVHECLDVAAKMMPGGSGGTNARGAVVLEGSGEKRESPMSFQGGQFLAAQALAQGPVTPSQLAPTINQTAPDMSQDTIPLAYGQMPSATRSQRAQQLGVNEFAMPEVGEAFGSFTVSRQSDEIHWNYMDEEAQPGLAVGRGQLQPHELAKPQRDQTVNRLVHLTGLAVAQVEQYAKPSVWNAHYAGVVARSGVDAVTLENYNREVWSRWEITRVFKKLERDVAAFRLFQAAHTDLKGMLQPIYQAAAANVSVEVVQAAQSLRALTQQVAQHKTEMWFFRMSGPAQQDVGHGLVEDQSFHKAMMDVGDFANPLTMRLRGRTRGENWNRRAAGMDVASTKDNYQQMPLTPANPGEVHQQELRLLEVLAYANTHVDQDRSGRRSRVDGMRGVVGVVAAAPGPNQELAQHVAQRLTLVSRAVLTR